MTTEEIITYILSEEELFFLTHMLEIKPVFGVADPYRGYLIEEIKARYETVKAGMMEKEYLSINEENGLLDIDPLLSACILACGEDDGIQLAKRIPDAPAYQANLYVTPYVVAEITPHPELDKHLVLRPLANAKITIGELYHLFPEQAYTEKHWFVDLEEMSFDRWLALSPEDQVELMTRKGCAQVAAEEAMQASQIREFQGSMRKWKREKNYWQAAGIYYVSFESLVYLASEQPGKRLRIETYNPIEVESFLAAFEKRFVIVEKEENKESNTNPDITMKETGKL